MPALSRAACILLLTATALSARAQNPPALSVSPGKASMVVGETRTFRAVGKDGRIRHNVRWSISPELAAAHHCEWRRSHGAGEAGIFYGVFNRSRGKRFR